jgi:hypothetical protein
MVLGLMGAFVRIHTASKNFKAPLDFVYAWCTDFREDDRKMTGSKRRRQILMRSPEMVVWKLDPKGTRGREGIRVVWLAPPDQWHLETCGDGSEVGDYKLTTVGTKKTRLNMVFRLTYSKRSEIEKKKEWESRLEKNWDAYGRFLEKEYLESAT